MIFGRITSCSGSSALLVGPASARRPSNGYRQSLIVTRKGSLSMKQRLPPAAAATRTPRRPDRHHLHHPRRTDPMGGPSPGPSPVGSNTPRRADAVDEVVRLKRKTDGDLSVGGAGLAASLLDLIDEFRPTVVPPSSAAASRTSRSAPTCGCDWSSSAPSATAPYTCGTRESADGARVIEGRRKIAIERSGARPAMASARPRSLTPVERTIRGLATSLVPWSHSWSELVPVAARGASHARCDGRETARHRRCTVRASNS